MCARLQYFRAIATSRNGTRSVGAASDFMQRAWEHKTKVIPGCAARYHVHTLVYDEVHATDGEVARREKRFNHWCRPWKLSLI